MKRVYQKSHLASGGHVDNPLENEVISKIKLGIIANITNPLAYARG